MYCPIVKEECKEDCAFKLNSHCIVSDCLTVLFLKLSRESDIALASKEMAERLNQLSENISGVVLGNIPPEFMDILKKTGDMPPGLKEQLDKILKEKKDDDEKQDA